MRKSPAKFDMELFFKALADRTRLRLLSLISKEEICVCFLVVVFGTNQPKISRHLAYLRRAGLVKARREGKWMHYSISLPLDPTAARMFDDILMWLSTEPQMQRDRQQLERVCCASQPPISIQGAPRPASLGKVA
jgi:ArsR family transcriptional regulator